MYLPTAVEHSFVWDMATPFGQTRHSTDDTVILDLVLSGKFSYDYSNIIFHYLYYIIYNIYILYQYNILGEHFEHIWIFGGKCPPPPHHIYYYCPAHTAYLTCKKYFLSLHQLCLRCDPLLLIGSINVMLFCLKKALVFTVRIRSYSPVTDIFGPLVPL